MNKAEVEKAKLKLDKSLRDAILGFTEKTGCEVDKISISRSSIQMHKTGRRDYDVTTWIWMK